MEIIQFSKPPTLSFIYVKKSSISLTLDVQFQTNHPSSSGNQSIQIKHNPRMTLICYQVLPSAFIFSINLLISSSFHLTFLHLAEASLSAFSWLYTLVCEVVQKYHEMYFTYNHFLYSFCNQPALFAQGENVNKLWNNNRTVHVNEQDQSKSCLIQIEYLLHCSIYPTKNADVSLKDAFTFWYQSQKEDFFLA